MDNFALVVNTCCLGPGRFTESSGGVLHQQREWLIKNLILPWATRQPLIREIVIAGEFETGEGYLYVPCPSKSFDCTDALAQRQRGFDAVSDRCDWIIFQHDDHLLAENFLNQWRAQIKGADVYSPARFSRARIWTGERLNNGEGDGYISGHCSVVSRDVAEAVPWDEVPQVFTWDIEYTKLVKEAGFSIQWTDVIHAYDVEFGATPWL